MFKQIDRIFKEIGRRKAVFARWVDAFWGYDVFVAHRRADAATYAQALHDELKAEGISCFIDRVVYAPGDSLLVATRRHVAKSTLFVLLGSPELAIIRRPLDWVEHELSTYLASHADPKVLVVDFGHTVSNSLGSSVDPALALHPILRLLSPFLRLDESASSLAAHPSDQVLDSVRRLIGGRRRDRARLHFFQGVAAVLFVLMVAAVALGGIALVQRKRAEQNLLQALKLDSRRLAAESERQLEAGRADLAALLVREALDGSIPDMDDRKRPFVPESAAILARALAYRPLAVEAWDFDTGVQFVTFSSDGHYIFILTEDGRALLRDRTRTQEDRWWAAHKDQPQGAAFSPSNKMIATAGHDNFSRLWNAETGSEIRALPSEGPVRSVAFDQTGHLLVSASDDGTARLWNVESGEQIARFSCSNTLKREEHATIQQASFSPDNEDVAIACSDGTTEIWAVRASQRKLSLKEDAEVIWSVKYSPDGKFIVTGSGNGTVRIWSAVDGSMRNKLTDHADRVKSLEFSRDGKYFITGSDDFTAIIWEWSTGRKVQSLIGHRFYVLHAEISPDGLQAATASWDNTVRFWQLTNTNVTSVLHVGDGGVTSAMFSPTGDTIAVGSWNGNVAILNGGNGETIRRLPHGRSVVSVAFSPDGKLLATASVNDTLDHGILSFWSPTSGERLFALPDFPDGIQCVAFDRDGQLILIAREDGSVAFWDIKDRVVKSSLPKQEDSIEFAAFSAVDDRVVTATHQGIVRIWDSVAGRMSTELPLQGVLVHSVAFDPTGNSVIVAKKDGNTSIHDARTGALVRALPRQKGEVQYAEFSPDSTKIVTATSEGLATIWEAKSARPIESYYVFDPNEGSKRDLSTAKFSPDGNRILLGGGDGSIRIWSPVNRTFEQLLSTAITKRALTRLEQQEFNLVHE